MEKPEIPHEIEHVDGLQLWCPAPASPMGYIYFLCRRGVVLYVGKTLWLDSRLLAHRQEVPFDAAFYIAVPRDSLDTIECAYIKSLRPPLNRSKNPSHDGSQGFKIPRCKECGCDLRDQPVTICERCGRGPGRGRFPMCVGCHVTLMHETGYI